MTTAGNTPGGDLTDHGADPAERQDADDMSTESEEQSSTPEGSAPSEQSPGGGLTDHGVDPDGPR